MQYDRNHHGGRIKQAVATFNIPESDWLDLSTGINPDGWPIIPVPEAAWRRLPEDDDELLHAASLYYQSKSLIAAAGTQSIIQALPQIMPAKYRVAIPEVGYAEHQYAWQRHGHPIVFYPDEPKAEYLDQLIRDGQVDIAVVIHPNNPSSRYSSVDQLLSWQQLLAQKNGLLIVDEAFIDPTPNQSLLPFSPAKGLVVLRSMGKFFGLAGMRVGFAAAEQTLLEELCEHIGPWAVAGPARWQAIHALRDYRWQDQARDALRSASRALVDILLEQFGQKSSGTVDVEQASAVWPYNMYCDEVTATALFASVFIPYDDAEKIYLSMARQGILLRLFKLRHGRGCLRIGLPKGAAQLKRFAEGLRLSCAEACQIAS